MATLATIEGTCPKLKNRPRVLEIRDDEIWGEKGIVMVCEVVPGCSVPAWSARVKIADLKEMVLRL